MTEPDEHLFVPIKTRSLYVKMKPHEKHVLTITRYHTMIKPQNPEDNYSIRCVTCNLLIHEAKPEQIENLIKMKAYKKEAHP